MTCLNISEAQNETNRERNRNAGLDAKIRVVHGSFEAIPEPDGSYDVVWSQDAILHAADRRKVIEEAFRVLKAGGELIFTDPMQADEVPDGVLTPVYDRLNLADLGSMRFIAKPRWRWVSKWLIRSTWCTTWGPLPAGARGTRDPPS